MTRTSTRSALRQALVLAACLAVAGPAAPSVVFADEAADAAKAFEEGRKKWDAKDPAGALPLFQKAAQQSGSPNARLYVARCLRETGKLTQAYDEMARTVADARALAEKDERYAQTRDTAAAELALLEAKVGKIVVALGSTLAGASVTIDGVAVDAGRLGKPIPVDPGARRVVATTANGATSEQTITVASGSTQTVTLERASPVAPPSSDAASVAPPAVQVEESGGFGVVRGLGIGVAALGVGGFVAFAIGTVQADEKFAELEAGCGAGPCTDERFQDVIDSGKTAETVAYVGLGVGIAGVVAGTFMMIFGGPSEPDAPAAAYVVEPTGDGLRIRF